MEAAYFGIPVAIWFYIIAFIVIWTLALLFKDKLKIDITGPLLMRRTAKLRDFIDSIAQKSPRFWKVLMSIGIPVAVFFMVLFPYLLANSLWSTINALIFVSHAAAQATSGGVAIVLPGVDTGSGFTVPLGYGLIGLITVIVVHEFAHGILARTEGIKIKSIGLLLFAILPGAFVEPDPEGVKKVSRLARLRIYAAGSIFNIGLAAIAFVITLLISTLFIAPTFDPNGLEVVSTMSNSPADGILKAGMIINNINGHEIKNRTDFTDILNKTKPGDILTIKTDKGTFKIKTTNNPNNSSAPYIGVRTQEHLVIKKDVSSKYGNILPWIIYSLYDLFFWIFFLNLGIGTFNLIPAKPLDGGLILEELLNYRLSESLSNKITFAVSIFSAVLIITTISLGYMITSNLI